MLTTLSLESGTHESSLDHVICDLVKDSNFELLEFSTFQMRLSTNMTSGYFCLVNTRMKKQKKIECEDLSGHWRSRTIKISNAF